MAVLEIGSHQMTTIFISYSRKDSDFVRRLNTALGKRGHDVWVDWEDIPRGEKWINEIYNGIENADAFIFVVRSFGRC